MSVIYKGKTPDRNYTTQDFYDNGVNISWCKRFYSHNHNTPSLRCVFRSNGLLGEIRTTCHGTSYAVDVRWGWWSSQEKCLTTECKSLREAQSILFEWFKSMGFSVPKEETNRDWTKGYLAYDHSNSKFKQLIKLPPLKEFEIHIMFDGELITTVYSTLQLYEIRCLIKENPNLVKGKKITFKIDGENPLMGKLDEYGRMDRESKRDKRLSKYESYLNKLMS